MINKLSKNQMIISKLQNFAIRKIFSDFLINEAVAIVSIDIDRVAHVFSADTVSNKAHRIRVMSSSGQNNINFSAFPVNA